MNIYVGNLAYKTTQDDLREAFEAFGAVDKVQIITDKLTGQSKGFGFVEMTEASAAKAAIDGLNGKDIGGRTLTVNEARPRTDRPAGGGFGGRGGRGDGGGYR